MMSKPNLKLTTALAVLPLCLWSHGAVAEPITEVIVSVTRDARPISRIGQAVAVMDDATIAAYQTPYVAELLTHTPSLVLSRNGGPGAAASASIRGAGADHTLYLLDGVRLNDPSQVGGGTNLGLLATDDLDRIEVLRGPLSTLWGSGALGGVISLTSRQAQAPLEAQLSLDGFDDYGVVRAAIGGHHDRLDWRISGQSLKDDGVSAFGGGAESDPFSQTAFNARAAYAVTDATTLRAFSTYSRSRNAYDGYPAPSYAFADTEAFGHTHTRLSSLSLHHRLGRSEHTLSLSESKARRHDDFADGSMFIARGHIQSADYHVLYRPDDQTRILAGLGYQRDTMRIASPATWDPDPAVLSRSVTTASLYGQVVRDFGPASVALSARHDDASSFGSYDIAQVSFTAPAGPFLLRASAGTGVKVPSLYQLYSDYGTAGLVPETGVTVDAGADLMGENGRIGVTVFSRTVRNLIGFAYDGCQVGQVYGCYGNIDRSSARGVELTGAQAFGAWTISGHYSLMDTRNESPGFGGKALPRTPEQLGSLDVAWQATPRLALGLGLRQVGNSFDNAANTVPLKGHGLVDLRASYALSDRITLTGRIENAGDTRYETAVGYGQPGRRVWIGLNTRLL